MTRTRTLEPGVEEWSCTVCSRRLLLRWPPAFEKVVLDRGDEWAAHVGGSGGVRAGTADVAPAADLAGAAEVTPAAGEVPAELAGLPAADRDWLAAQGIEWGPEGTP
jgi:hypothetical protein